MRIRKKSYEMYFTEHLLHILHCSGVLEQATILRWILTFHEKLYWGTQCLHNLPTTSLTADGT